MRGNAKPTRGLFSGMKRTVIASATALSLAVGGMAVPALESFGAGEFLPAATAATSSLLYSSGNWIPLDKGWSRKKPQDVPGTPQELVDFSKNKTRGWLAVANNDSGASIQGFSKIEFSHDRTTTRSFPASGEYYVWVETPESKTATGTREVANGEFYKVEGKGNGTTLTLELPKTVTLQPSQVLYAFAPNQRRLPTWGIGASGSATLSSAPKGTVTGRLNAPTSFIDEARIDLLDANGNVVDSRGARRGQTFTFQDTPTGDYKLRVRNIGGFNGETTQTFTLRADATETRDLTLTAQKASVKGSVKDEDEQPVAGATVRIKGTDLKAQTKTDGSFEIANIPDGTYTVEVGETSKTVGTTTSVSLKPGEEKENLELRVDFHKRNATGRVLNEKDESVSGASLTLSGNGQADRIAKTDANGNYTFEGLKPGTYTVVVASSTEHGSGGGQLNIQADRDTQKDFKVTRNKASITGKGSIAGSNEKPADVKLRLVRGGKVVSTATTNANGEFTFAGVDADTYAIEIVEDDRFHGGATEQDIVVEPGETRNFALEMEYKKSTASGDVLLDGNPLPGVAVKLTKKDTKETFDTETNSRGFFTRGGLQPGTYVASVAGKAGEYDEGTSDEVRIAPGETKPLNITLTSLPGNVTGKVTDNFGKPVAGAKVTAGSKTATTGTDGTYKIEGLPKGEVTVTVARNTEQKYASASTTVTIAPSQTKNADLTVTRDLGSIVGTVKDDGGTPLNSGAATITGPNGLKKDVTISRGKFQLGGLTSGEYTVDVHKTKLTNKTSTKVTVRPGESAAADLQVRRFQGKYTVKVFDDLGEAVQGATVVVSGTGFKQSKQTNADGVAQFDNVAPGKYSYTVLAADEYGQASGSLTPIVEDAEETMNVSVSPTDGRIEGTVRDDAGNPVAGAVVKIDGKRRSGDQEAWSGTATTGADGKYTVDAVPPGTFVAKVDATDTRGGASTEVTVRPNEPSAGNLTLRRNDGNLGGTVTDDNGSAVAGAKVVLKSADGKQEIDSTETGADGTYEFAGIRPGEYLVEVAKTSEYGAASETAQVDPGVKNNRDIRVNRADGGVEGTVVDENGNAVANATVTIYGDGVEEELSTNAEGKFALTGLRPGNYRVEVAATTEYGATAGTFTVEPGSTATLTLEVNRNKSTVSGQVSDDAHQVIEGADVTITDVEGTVVATETTDADGNFTVENLAPGTYTAAIDETETHNADSKEFTVVAGEFTDLVTLTAGRKAGTLVGQVVDADTGKPITGATLTLIANGADAADGKNITVNGEGAFEVPVDAGKYTLQVESPEFYEPYSDRIFEVGAAESLDLGKIALTSTVGTIAGTVTDADGTPLENVEVTVHNLENGAESTVTTNAQGKYTASNRATGRYTVSVTAPEGYDTPKSQEVSVERTKTATADFKVNKTPKAPQVGTVSGQVLDSDGKVVDGASVALNHLESGKAYPATVNAEGRFTAKELPAGEYSVIASADGYKAEGKPRVNVEAGKNADIGRINLVKDATPQGTFRVVVQTGPKGQEKPVADAVVVVSQGDDQRSFVTGANGEAKGQLPEGTYSVRVTPPAESDFLAPAEDTTVTIKRNEQSDAFFNLDRPVAASPDVSTGRVIGSIADENGAPVDGTSAKLRGEDGTVIELDVDENGNFDVDDVPEGKYTLIVTPGEDHRTPRYEKVEVNRGETTDVGRITTPSTVKPIDESDKGEPGTINGWLVDDKNEPIPGATVIIRGKGTDKDPDGNPIDTLPAVSVDENGRFTTDVLPEGEYEIDLDLPEGWDKPEGWPKSVNVTEDKPEYQGVINVVAPRSEVKGSVVDGDGNPIDGVIVTVTDSHGDTKEVPVDENGNYKLDVVPGDAIVEVFTPEGVQDVDPTYIPVRPKVDVALPTVNLTEQTLKLRKRVLGWDADTPEDAPGLPSNEELIYGFVVTNESDQTVHDVKIEDPFADAAIKAPKDWDGSLAPKQTKVFTAVMKPPYGSGAFANVAVARGHFKNKDGSQGDMVASTPDEAYVTFMDMSLMKKVNAQLATDPKNAVRMAADRDLYFTYEVVNTGSTRMENVTVTDMIYEGDKDDFDPNNPGKGKKMKIIPPKGFTGTLRPGERAVFKGVLPPLKPGTRHHNAAEASGKAPAAPKRSRIFEEEPDYGDDPSGLLVVSPKQNIDGNAHIIVEEGAPLATSDVHGKLFVDVNTNGKIDDGDKPYGGMEITLHSLDGMPDLSTTSDGDGKFAFPGVNAGSYTLQMRNPGGVVLAEPLDAEKNDNGIGAQLESKKFEIDGEKDKENLDVLLLDRPLEFEQEPPADGSSLGKCISETSSVTNPATWLIPIGILIAALGGAAVLFEDEFNAAAAEFNKAMPSLNIQRPEWMNQISRQLAEIDPAVPAAVLAVGIIGLGALALGLTYAACESGKDLSSSKDSGSSSKKDEKEGETLTTAAEPSPANA